MKTWAITVRYNIKEKTDLNFVIKAYNRAQIVDQLGDIYWIMEIEELYPQKQDAGRGHPFYEENTNATR